MKEVSATRRRFAAAARRHGDVEARVSLLEVPGISLAHITVRLCDPHTYTGPCRASVQGASTKGMRRMVQPYRGNQGQPCVLRSV